jgi:hypothetical protein
MKNLKKILTAATLVAAASSASAIQFDLAPASFTPGSGYSAGGAFDANKLGVDFVANPSLAETFTLTSGSSITYTFGTVTLNDPELLVPGGYICGGSWYCLGTDETDNLGVTATFSFSSPVVGNQFVTASGTATVGRISDSWIDFSIDWADEIVMFGNGGEFHIHMDDISFTSNGQMKNQTYSIELVTAPIPEPETYALMLAGLGLVGFMARRRKQA